MKLLSFGEILWDVYPDGKYIGGAPLNFAAHYAKQTGSAWMLSSVGNDELGAEALKRLSAWGIGTDYVSVLDGIPTGQCLVTLDESSVPSYELLSNVAYDLIGGELHEDARFDAIYFGTFALRSKSNLRFLEDLLEKQRFNEIVVDINIRPPHYSAESVSFALSRATLLKISDEELPAVAKTAGLTCDGDLPSVARSFCDRFPQIRLLLITQGEKGSLAYERKSDKCYSASAPRVTPVSTVGAGDSFAASFSAAYFGGADIQSSLDRAAKVSAFVVSQRDAVPDYPCGLITP